MLMHGSGNGIPWNFSSWWFLALFSWIWAFLLWSLGYIMHTPMAVAIGECFLLISYYFFVIEISERIIARMQDWYCQCDLFSGLQMLYIYAVAPYYIYQYGLDIDKPLLWKWILGSVVFVLLAPQMLYTLFSVVLGLFELVQEARAAALRRQVLFEQKQSFLDVYTPEYEEARRRQLKQSRRNELEIL